MLGELILKIRKDKKISKTELSRETNMNIGHITHIEKGERTPSHKALKSICKTLDVPYQQLMYTYDKELTEEQKKYNCINHIAYDSIPAINNIDELIHCPSSMGNSSFAVYIKDDNMEPTILKGSYAFIELNSPLSSKDISLIYYNNTFLIRRFIIKKNNLVLRADNKNIADIILSADSNFTILGKVLGTNTDF